MSIRLSLLITRILIVVSMTVTTFTVGAQQSEDQKLAQEVGLALAKARAGDAEAQYQVGNYYRRGIIPGMFETPDNKEAARWYAKSAYGGCIDGMVAHAGCLIEGYLAKNPKEAIKWYEKAAKSGNVSAYYNIGFCYDKGIGVQQNNKKAVKYYKKAAKMGSAFAANSLAICYYTGKGVIKDYPEAYRLFKMAADSGNPAAFANVARCYMFGQGTNVNSKLGVMWYEKAADKGYADSQFFLGQLFYAGKSAYCEGVNISIDYMKAAHFLKMAIENPQLPDFAKGETYRLLASCYRFGRGLESDENKANELTSMAASFGDTNAKQIVQWLSNDEY